MEKIKKVPDLRFEGFEESLITNEIGNIISRKKTYPVTRSKETSEYTGVKYVHYGDIHTNKSKLISKSLDLPNIQDDNYNVFLKKGDIILADASEDYEGVGNPAILLEDFDVNIIAGLHTIAFEPNCSPIFLFYLLGTRRYQDYMRIKCTGTKVYGITFNNFKDFTVVYPSETEQTQIGSLFKNLDEKIDLEKEKLNKLKNYKKAMLDDMFPKEGEKVPEVRFDGFDGEWEETTIDYIPGRLKYNKGSGLIKDDLVRNQRYNPAILYGHIFTEYGSNLKEVRFSTLKAPNGCTYSEIGDLIIPASSTTSDNAIIKGLAVNKSGIIYGGDINIIRFDNNVTNIFLAYYLDNSCLKSRMFKVVQGTTIHHLYLNKIKDVFVQIPSPQEQALIGDFFKNLDEKIDLLEEKIVKIENFKKAMLDKMFV